jgi:hypothetical protein
MGSKSVDTTRDLSDSTGAFTDVNLIEIVQSLREIVQPLVSRAGSPRRPSRLPGSGAHRDALFTEVNAVDRRRRPRTGEHAPRCRPCCCGPLQSVVVDPTAPIARSLAISRPARAGRRFRAIGSCVAACCGRDLPVIWLDRCARCPHDP